MFRQILFVNWKAARFGMIPFLLAAFALPLLTVQQARVKEALPETASVRGAELLQLVSLWTPLYPALALAIGAVLALMVWNWDHKGQHVYPLVLPLSRSRYVLLKMGAGIVLLMAPVILLWVGSLLAVSMTDIPEGLRAYPTLISFRFLLATLISFAVFFALAAGTMRLAIILLCAWVGVVFLGEVLPPIMGDLLDFQPLRFFSLLEWTLEAVMSWPGPFEVYAGNWMLIDV